MSAVEGRVRVVLDGEGRAREVSAQRPVLACRLFEGRRVEQVPIMAGALFSLCGQSQQVAAEAALSAATGREPSPERRRHWQQRLTLETLREHLTRLLLDWLPLKGGAPAVGWFQTFSRTLARLELEVESAWEELAGQLAALDEHLLALARWIEEQGLAGVGYGDSPPLPPLDPEELDRRLAADQDGRFCARPHWQGQVFETGPLARQSHRPAVAKAIEDHGRGLLARLIARRLELWGLMENLRHPRQDPGIGLVATGQGGGLAWVENARGRLYHRATVQEGKVTHYRVLAPTEWNFHPDGPLARGLNTPSGSLDPQRRARLAVLALDPCVGCEIVVQ